MPRLYRITIQKRAHPCKKCVPLCLGYPAQQCGFVFGKDLFGFRHEGPTRARQHQTMRAFVDGLALDQIPARQASDTSGAIFALAISSNRPMSL